MELMMWVRICTPLLCLEALNVFLLKRRMRHAPLVSGIGAAVAGVVIGVLLQWDAFLIGQPAVMLGVGYGVFIWWYVRSHPRFAPVRDALDVHTQ
jgi:hypothetical protein